MISVNRVAYLVLSGATYDNLEAIRKAGGQWDNGARIWIIKIETHPLNNTKQRKVLETMLSKLEENGVRFVKWMTDGSRA
jgi:hypothetical protein